MNRNRLLSTLYMGHVLIIGFFFCCIGCQKESNSNPMGPDTTASIVMPLAVGNYWVSGSYRGTDTNTIFMMDSTVISESIFITDEMWYKKEGWYKLNDSTDTWHSNGFSLVTNRSDGFYVNNVLSNNYSKILPNPGWVGLQWIGANGDSCSVVSINEAVIVPVAPFENCIKYSVKEPGVPYYNYVWFKSGVGTIREYNTFSPTTVIIKKLLRFRVQ